MSIIKEFIPDNYSKLSERQKKFISINLANALFESLHLKPIKIKFADIISDDGKFIAGHFSPDPLKITINKRLISGEYIQYLSDTGIDKHVAYPYFLVSSIAHECYHHYQYTLENKLINGEEIDKKVIGVTYLNFVCGNDKLFTKCNKKLGIYIPTDISDDEISAFSPIEISAKDFAYKIVEKLASYDYSKNSSQYEYFYFTQVFQNISKKLNKKNNLVTESINHSLQNAIVLLNYLKEHPMLDNPYSKINIVELEKHVTKESEKWKEREIRETNFYHNSVAKKL